ncbi:MAG TPA: efflux RND transporter periplasmic adaptor subunit [Verrucomicrobiae bacterium]|nr:efflux RND transporter periplasmic adaptor subunit [Verrucomicrobiae bacterium]
MKRNIPIYVALLSVLCVFVSGCGSDKADPQAEAPPPAQVIHVEQTNIFEVDNPQQFPLVQAGRYDAASELSVTGSVTPDISRNVPVISIATGRVVEVFARLGDTVRKGQLLLRVESSDVSGAFSDYQKAEADETLARKQLERANDLYTHGAIALADLEAAQDAEQKAKIDVETAAAHLRLLGNDPSHPTGVVDIVAPVSGVITDQEITNAGGIQGLSSPNPFTISDLSYVWVLCDVYENNLPDIHVGEMAEIRLDAYPGKVLRGRIGNIGAILDPNLRTAKVRIEVRNPGFLRPGMFVTATFYGLHKEVHASVPASAILHLHDRDWVYEPAGGKTFRRVEVGVGNMLPGNMQEVTSGVAPGTQVVRDSLLLQNTVEQ